MKGLFFGLLILIILIIVLPLTFLGFMPGLSSVFGTNKPRDLGIRWTETDRVGVHAKSGLKFEALPPETPAEKSIQRSGSHPLKTEFTSAEISATMNDRAWRYWPYKNVQMRFNGDGSAEVSGSLIKSRIPSYCAAIGVPGQAVEFAMKFLPTDPVFYVKGRATLTENKLSLFEPESLQIGRLPVPLGPILSLDPNFFTKAVYAAGTDEMLSQLQGISNKKALIMDFINQRLSKISGFYAKSASFGENKLMFDGSVSDKVSTVN